MNRQGLERHPFAGKLLDFVRRQGRRKKPLVRDTKPQLDKIGKAESPAAGFFISVQFSVGASSWKKNSRSFQEEKERTQWTLINLPEKSKRFINILKLSSLFSLL